MTGTLAAPHAQRQTTVDTTLVIPMLCTQIEPLLSVSGGMPCGLQQVEDVGQGPGVGGSGMAVTAGCLRSGFTASHCVWSHQRVAAMDWDKWVGAGRSYVPFRPHVPLNCSCSKR